MLYMFEIILGKRNFIEKHATGVLWCSVCLCTGHFAKVPLNLTCLRCLKHFFSSIYIIFALRVPVSGTLRPEVRI